MKIHSHLIMLKRPQERIKTGIFLKKCSIIALKKRIFEELMVCYVHINTFIYCDSLLLWQNIYYFSKLNDYE